MMGLMGVGIGGKDPSLRIEIMVSEIMTMLSVINLFPLIYSVLLVNAEIRIKVELLLQQSATRIYISFVLLNSTPCYGLFFLT